MMQRGKVPEAFSDQWSGDDAQSFVPPWQPVISMRIGHARLKKISELLVSAAAGFAVGGFAHLPATGKIGAVSAALLISVLFSWLATKNLNRALEIQRSAIDSMKIKDLKVVDMTTGKVTYPEEPPPEPAPTPAPTEPAPAPTKE